MLGARPGPKFSLAELLPIVRILLFSRLPCLWYPLSGLDWGTNHGTEDSTPSLAAQRGRLVEAKSTSWAKCRQADEMTALLILRDCNDGS
jgi:hypothetical protein